MKIYMIRVLLGLDQFVNTIFGGFPNETLSARAWRKGGIGNDKKWRCLRILIDFMFSMFSSNHCEISYLYCRKATKLDQIYFPIVCPKCAGDYKHLIKKKVKLPIDFHDSNY